MATFHIGAREKERNIHEIYEVHPDFCTNVSKIPVLSFTGNILRLRYKAQPVNAV
jgi:hypothetical protein